LQTEAVRLDTELLGDNRAPPLFYSPSTNITYRLMNHFAFSTMSGWATDDATTDFCSRAETTCAWNA